MPEQVKAHLVMLQRGVLEECRKFDEAPQQQRSNCLLLLLPTSHNRRTRLGQKTKLPAHLTLKNFVEYFSQSMRMLS
jgi:hypothetical protein